MERYKLYHGGCLEIMPAFESESGGFLHGRIKKSTGGMSLLRLTIDIIQPMV